MGVTQRNQRHRKQHVVKVGEVENWSPKRKQFATKPAERATSISGRSLQRERSPRSNERIDSSSKTKTELPTLGERERQKDRQTERASKKKNSP